MIGKSDQLVKRLLNKSALKDRNIDDLKTITDQYPYFSAAQLLLARRLEISSEAHARQKAKAALFVYDPLQVEDLLNETQEVLDALVEQAPDVETPIPAGSETITTSSAPDPLTAPVVETTTAGSPAAESHIKLTSHNLQEPAATDKLDITFEPYHTVDYFASQGIKLSQSDVPVDRFGRQLKSFTEWLKTMKKLPTTAITHNTDGAGERKVESLAAHSLQKSEIITESMAEVWIKQGNLEKASEVYNKLSLQNPSKKAYFAAKIESLKKPN